MCEIPGIKSCQCQCPCKLYLTPHIADIWAIIRSCTFPHCLLSCSSCLPSCAFCYLAMPLLSMCILSFVLENKRSLIINHSPTKKRKKQSLFLKNICTTIPRDFKVTLLNVNFVLRFLEFKVLPQQPGTKWSLFDFQCWAVKRHIWYNCDIFTKYLTQFQIKSTGTIYRYRPPK